MSHQCNDTGTIRLPGSTQFAMLELTALKSKKRQYTDQEFDQENWEMDVTIGCIRSGEEGSGIGREECLDKRQ